MVSKMYTEYVLSTFVPSTIGRLCQELRRCELECTAIGEPASPGRLGAGTALTELRRSATDRARVLLLPLFDHAPGGRIRAGFAGRDGAGA
jgi:hypothetical protein